MTLISIDHRETTEGSRLSVSKTDMSLRRLEKKDSFQTSSYSLEPVIDAVFVVVDDEVNILAHFSFRWIN